MKPLIIKDIVIKWRAAVFAVMVAVLLLPPHAVSAGARNTVNLFLVVDTSASMKAQWDNSDVLGDSLQSFVQNTPDSVTRITLLTFTYDTKILHMENVNSQDERDLIAGVIRNKLDAEFEYTVDAANIGDGMVYAADLAAGMGGQGVESVVVMLTDAYNSDLGRRMYPEKKAEILRYAREDMSFHFLELQAGQDAVGADWVHADLAETAEEIGGGYRLIEEPSGLGEALDEINTVTESAAPPAPEVNALMTTNLAGSGAPVTETGMLEGSDLIVQVLLINPDTRAVISGDVEYEKYVSTLFIKKDTDSTFHQSVMTSGGSSYRITMTLPDYGVYDFYICLSHAGSPDVFFYEGEHQAVQVFEKITPRAVSLGDTPVRLTSAGDGGTDFRISASLMMEENGESINGAYYNIYSAVAFIKAKGETEDQAIKLMAADGGSYFIDFVLLDDGAYEYRVEIMAGDETLVSRSAQVTVVGEFTLVATALMFALSAFAIAGASFLLFMERRFGFIVSISDGITPNLLTYGVRLGNLGARFKLTKLLSENKTGVKIEPAGDESRRREVISAIKPVSGSVMFTGYKESLTVTVKGGEGGKLSPGDSVTFPMEGGGNIYFVTVLRIEA